MVNKKSILALFFWLLPCVVSADPWTNEQKYLEAGYLVVLFVDYKQTLVIADNSDEVNPMLGANPTTRQVQNHFVKGAVLHWALAAVMPAKWRTRFLYTTVGFESAYVLHNHWLGYRVEF